MASTSLVLPQPFWEPSTASERDKLQLPTKIKCHCQLDLSNAQATFTSITRRRLLDEFRMPRPDQLVLFQDEVCPCCRQRVGADAEIYVEGLGGGESAGEAVWPAQLRGPVLVFLNNQMVPPLRLRRARWMCSRCRQLNLCDDARRGRAGRCCRPGADGRLCGHGICARCVYLNPLFEEVEFGDGTAVARGPKDRHLMHRAYHGELYRGLQLGSDSRGSGR